MNNVEQGSKSDHGGGLTPGNGSASPNPGSRLRLAARSNRTTEGPPTPGNRFCKRALLNCWFALLPLLTTSPIAAGEGPGQGGEPSTERPESRAPEPALVPFRMQPLGAGTVSSRWRGAVTPYLFLARLDGSVSAGRLGNDISVPAGTLLDELEFAAAGRFEVGKGHWTGLFDVNYLALGDQADLPLGGRLDVDIDMLTFEAALAYRLGSQDSGLDILGGIRYVRQNFKGNRTGGVGAGRMRQFTPDWVDPIVGIRFRHELSPRTFLLLRGDIGGFGAGSEFSWNIEAGGEFRFTRHLGLQILFKALDLDYQEGSGPSFYEYDVVSPGVVLAFPIRF